jgi:fumarylpyruvate hydrolase
MSSQYVIEPVALPSLPVAGDARRFAVNRIYCVGRNYADHAREMGHDPDREPPFFFMKPASAIVTDGANMQYPSLSNDVHHEIEMVVAIGKGGANITADKALEHVYGYGVGLDMTRRDLQAAMKKEAKPWCIGKGFDHGAPIGPLFPIESTGEITAGPITLKVNGEVRQQGDIADLIWSINEVIAHVSNAWVLQAGDLIYTGTPAGVGPVARGDVMTVEATRVGGFALKVV